MKIKFQVTSMQLNYGYDEAINVTLSGQVHDEDDIFEAKLDLVLSQEIADDFKVGSYFTVNVDEADDDEDEDGDLEDKD